MNLLGLLILFFVSTITLLVASDKFVKVAKQISQSLRISPLVVGTTIVAIGTSLPELAVSTIAAFHNDTGLVFGNIVGSNIVNITLVLSVGIFIGKIRIGTTKTLRSLVIMLLVTVFFVFMYIGNTPSQTFGFILLLVAGGVTVTECMWGISGRNHEDVKWNKRMKSIRFTTTDVMLLFGSLVGILLGGFGTVNAVEQLSGITGISTTVLGLSVTAIATSLPELLTTIFSEQDHEDKIALGNILGSNIYNLALIGGISLFISGKGSMGSKDLTMLLVSSFTLGVIIYAYRGKVVPKRLGAVFIVLFALYIYLLRFS